MLFVLVCQIDIIQVYMLASMVKMSLHVSSNIATSITNCFHICTDKSAYINHAMLGITVLAIVSVVIIPLIVYTYISEKCSRRT